MDVAEKAENNGDHSKVENNEQQQQQQQQQQVVQADNARDASMFEDVAAILEEQLFDWMPLADLHAVGQTCKGLKRLTGPIFRANYVGGYVECKKGNIFIGDVRISGFCDEIENIMFCEDDERSFQFVEAHEFANLKQVKFRKISFTAEKMGSILHILADAQAIELYECTVRGEFYRKFLRHCPEINRLVIEPVQNESNGILGWEPFFGTSLHALIGADNKWLLRHYPKLDYFGLHFDTGGYQCAELKSFFVLNPNIRKFATYADILVLTMDYWIREANLQLDDLAIKDYDCELGMYDGLIEILPRNQFSTRTQFYEHRAYSISEDVRHKYVPIELDKCHFVWGCDLDVDCYPFVFTSCREMCNMLLPEDNIAEAASTLVNLERISLWEATPAGIEALISRTPKLTTVAVLKAIDFADVDIDLQNWNQTREKLPEAQKVVIYVDEKTYLAMKCWKNDMQHRLVEIKRLESCKWQQDFDYHF